MVSLEFKTVMSNNMILRARIMLKDSLVVDPTFEQFDEMLAYAKGMNSTILVPFDGKILENDISKWNEEQMNRELVELVNNFSSERINHLKDIISKVLASKIKTIRSSSVIKSENRFTNSISSMNSRKLSGISVDIKYECRKKALYDMRRAVNDVNKVVKNVKNNGNRWSLRQIDDMEKCAEDILNSIKKYKENR